MWFTEPQVRADRSIASGWQSRRVVPHWTVGPRPAHSTAVAHPPVLPPRTPKGARRDEWHTHLHFVTLAGCFTGNRSGAPFTPSLSTVGRHITGISPSPPGTSTGSRNRQWLRGSDFPFRSAQRVARPVFVVSTLRVARVHVGVEARAGEGGTCSHCVGCRPFESARPSTSVTSWAQRSGGFRAGETLDLYTAVCQGPQADGVLEMHDRGLFQLCVDGWAQEFERESRTFPSFVLFCELKLSELVEADGGVCAFIARARSP